MRASIPRALEALGATVQTDDTALTASLRTGAQRRSVTLTWETIHTALEGSNDRALIAGFARGLMSQLNEPANARGESLSFLDTTPTIHPTVAGPGFVTGVRLAGGSEPFTQPYVDGFEFVYLIDLDEGQRLLPLAQVQAWGVHPERVEKAGLSILFHRSGHERWENHLVDGVLIRRLVIGDGSDGARGALLEFFDWQKVQTGRYFAFPSSEMLLFTDDVTPQTLDVFRRVVEGAYEKHALPLSTVVFQWEGGKLRPQPVP